jgi:hypothetical protein
MSHDAILSLKQEQHHGSIEMTEKALRRRMQWWRPQGEFSDLSLSLSLTLPY